MIRRVSIVYRPEDGKKSKEIETFLEKSGKYAVSGCVLNDNKLIEDYYDTWMKTEEPQMVITLNLAGFEWKNTGGNSMYSMLMGNAIHYVDKNIDGIEKLLDGLMPITWTFVAVSDDVKEQLERFRRIHDIRVVRSLKDLSDIMETLDWRI